MKERIRYWFIGIIVSLIILIPLIYGASAIIDNHGLTADTPQPADTLKTGAKIYVKTNSTLEGVNISTSSSATTVYLVADDSANPSTGTVLASARINGTGGSPYFANFTANLNNYSLVNGTQYYILIDGNGSSFSMGNSYQPVPNFASQNISGTNINWTYGVTNDALDNANVIGGIVAIWTNNGSTTSSLSASLNSPSNNSNFTTSSTIILNASGSTNLLIKNLTVTLYYPNGSMSKNSTTNGVTSASNITFTVGSLPEGMYNWSAFVYNNNSQRANSSVFFFNVSSLLINSEKYNTTTYETSYETFIIDIFSINASQRTAELIYDGTNYGNGTPFVSGDSATFTRTISIPQLSSSERNVGFYWKLYNGTTVTNSSNNTQRIAPSLFGFCNATITFAYINISFKNETTALENINASIISTWDYWIGNRSLNKTFSLTNSTAHRNYPFCFLPQNRTVNTYASIFYDNDESQQRSYTATLGLSNSTVQKILYLLPSSAGLFTRFIAQDILGNPLSNVLAVISRTISGSDLQIESDLTDSSGIIEFFLNPDFSYGGLFSKTGYSDNSFNFVPSSEQRTILMTSTSTTNFTGSQIALNTSYYIYPTNTSLKNGTTYSFAFNVTSNQAITLISMNITNSSGYQLAYQTSSGAGYISINVNTGNWTRIGGKFIIQTANETTTIIRTWIIGDEWIGDYSFNKQMTLFMEYSFSDFFRLILVIGIIMLLLIFMSAGEILDTSEDKMGAIVILVWIFSYVGWLSNPFVASTTGLGIFAQQYGIAILTTVGGLFFVIKKIFT